VIVDALNFNNLVIRAKGATSPIVKKLLMSNYLLFKSYFQIHIFGLFVTKNTGPYHDIVIKVADN
jgi:hypothetical protein